MDGKKKYLIQITGSDLQEIAMAANAHGGDGINILKNDNGLEVSIDLQFLQEVVLRILRGQSLI